MLQVGQFVLKGNWDTTPDPLDSVAIHLAPMPAGLVVYGYGWNPSTQGMLAAMEEIDFKGKTVLDVGTGTGILAIAAAKSRAAEVYAVDTSEDALIVARENAKLNDVEITFGYPDHADIILANLGDAEFVYSVAKTLDWIAEEESRRGPWTGTFTPGSAPTAAWLGERLNFIGATVIATLPEHSPVLGDALLAGFLVRTNVIGDGNQRFVVATLRRP